MNGVVTVACKTRFQYYNLVSFRYIKNECQKIKLQKIIYLNSNLSPDFRKSRSNHEGKNQDI